MIDQTLDIIVSRIRETAQPVKVTPRQLMRAFGYSRRRRNCVNKINNFLMENGLETFPNYQDTWADREIELRLTPKAEHEALNYMRCNSQEDPIKRLDVLDEAHNSPVCVKLSDSIIKAETLMRLHNYSQLPVVNKRGVLVGCITWNSICDARSKMETSHVVKAYATKECCIANVDMPLLRAYELVCKNDFLIVVGNDSHPIGIVTLADLSNKFIAWTAPYMVVNEIEQMIRLLCDDKYPKAVVKGICKQRGIEEILPILGWEGNDEEHAEQVRQIDGVLQKMQKEINSLDDLSFGQYITLLDNNDGWNALELSHVDKPTFISQLNKVRKIRNEIMHFNMNEEDSADKIELLKETAEFIGGTMLYKKSRENGN